jgi:adenosylhomocysteine nucleosidase
VASAVAPRILVLMPLVEEWSILVKACKARHSTEILRDLKMPCAYVPQWRLALAHGGHGKTQMAVQAQYLIDRFRDGSLVVCAGAAGSLDPGLSVGDVVIATETVEHDYRLLFATRPLPRFAGDPESLALLRQAAAGVSGFRVAFDVIASGDEDVVSAARAAEIRAQTGAVCVAWEGSGADARCGLQRATFARDPWPNRCRRQGSGAAFRRQSADRHRQRVPPPHGTRNRRSLLIASAGVTACP